MLNRLTRKLHFQNLYRFNKKKKNASFAFKSEDKKKTREATVTQSTQTDNNSINLTASAKEDSRVSGVDRQQEIANKIYSNNPIILDGGSFTVLDWLKNGGKIEDFASEKQRSYPSHVDHWNPEKKGYLHSEREEDRMNRSVDGYNKVVNSLREEIEVQKKYQAKLENMQRSHLKGVPGIQ
jgi:hypothetical protein